LFLLIFAGRRRRGGFVFFGRFRSRQNGGVGRLFDDFGPQLECSFHVGDVVQLRLVGPHSVGHEIANGLICMLALGGRIV
jgi:hypothetical protein